MRNSDDARNNVDKTLQWRMISNDKTTWRVDKNMICAQLCQLVEGPGVCVPSPPPKILFTCI